MNYLDFFTNSIKKLKDQGNYRDFLNISRLCGEFPYAINNKNKKKITVWCSNDYLGLGQNKDAILEACDAKLIDLALAVAGLEIYLALTIL